MSDIRPIVDGYQSRETLYVSGASVVFRARREADGRDVVVKALREPHPSREELEGLEREYELLVSLGIAEVAAPICLERVGCGVALVMEDTGGVGADVVARRPDFGLSAFLRLATAATAAIEAVHRRGVLHKDLKPSHMLVEPSGAVRLIDFGLAALVSDEGLLVDADRLEGTLEYVSPEQTGRVGRGVDARSDLYSLGVSLFELWTGRLPFTASDPLELVHAHLAKTPPRADEVRPGTDPMIAAILGRLLAKVPEERYQTAAGLRADLSRCLAQLDGSQAIAAIAPFELGADDVPEGFRLPEGLYGRASPLASLEAAAADVRAGQTRIVLLGGPSGVGKSRLVEALRQRLAGRFSFGAGKFDRLLGGRPYPALSDALRALTRRLLQAPKEVLERRRTELCEALGPNAAVVAELVPELLMVIDAAPPVTPLGPVESQNRFEQALGRFLGALGSTEAPLALFLDDLQWADPATLRLLRVVATAPGHAPLLFIGGFRDDEVGVEHPLALELAEVAKRHDGLVRRISLGPLGLDEVVAFTAAALSGAAGDLRPLAAALHRKTGGNPFHLGQFLLALHHEGLLLREETTHRWVWNLEAIEAHRVTDNVVDLVLGRIRALPREAQRLLSVGACVGQAFTLAVVSEVAGLEPDALRSAVDAAVREGLLAPLSRDERASSSGRRLRFVHDRVNEAALALLPEAERRQVHLGVGRHLKGALGPRPSDRKVFAVAQQLNRASGLLEPTERVELAEMNLSCARRAQATAAPATALEFLAAAGALLGVEGWSARPAIAFNVHLTRAECEYLLGNHRRSLADLDEIDRHPTPLLDQVAAGQTRVRVLSSLGELPPACRSAVETVRRLGVDLPDPSDAAGLERAIGQEYSGLQDELGGRAIDSLRALPEMTEPLRVAELNTLAAAIPAAYQSNEPLMVLLVLRGTRLSLRHGAGDATPFFFALAASALQVITQDHRTAYRWGRLAIEMGQARSNQSALGSVHFIFAAFVAHWCEPLRESLRHFRLGLKRSLESGDMQHACYCVGLGAAYQVHAGGPLEELAAELPRASQMVERLANMVNLAYLALAGRLVACLSGKSARVGSLDGDGFSEADFEARSPPIIRSWLWFCQALCRYHAGELGSALECVAGRTPIVGMASLPDYRFYEGLCRAGLARGTEEAQREEHLTCLGAVVEQFRSWAQLCPANHGHRLALLLAEAAETAGRTLEAMEQYDAAIDGALEQGHWLNHALACELAGEAYLRHHRARMARLHLREAIKSYRTYGAAAKAEQLAARHAELGVGGGAVEPEHGRLASSTAGRATGLALDIESAMRATQAIASELETPKLIDRLLRLVMASAGAQRVALLLPKDGDLVLEAEGSLEPDQVRLGLGLPLSHATELPGQLLRSVARTSERFAGGGAGLQAAFLDDEYVARGAPKSVLALPLVHQGQLRGVLYLEHRAAPQAFGPARVARIQFLADHAAAALVNAALYQEVQQARRELEHRVAERTSELSQRNRELRGVLDAITQGLVTVDEAGRVAGDVSAQAVAWFGGIRPGDVWAEVLARVDPAGARAFAEQLARSSVAPSAGSSSPSSPPSASSSLGRLPRALSVAGRSLRLELRPVEGAPAPRTLVVVSDITDEERQKQLEIELRHAQKLESVGQLAAGIAHEINTPAQFVGDSVAFLSDGFRDLRGLLGSYRQAVATGAVSPSVAQALAEAEATADVAFVEENGTQAFERALEGLSRITTLVQAMKEFAHPDHREQSPADLNRAIANTLAIARNAYKDVADVETELGELPQVCCHLSDVNQVFLNLLVNAAHAVEDVVGHGGTKGLIRVATRQVGGSVQIDIEDSGCGIPDLVRDRVFEPFFTTKEVGRGSGQGLAIARSIVVDKHGGTITFTTRVGKGTKFTVTLPIAGVAKREEERPPPARTLRALG